MILVFLLGLVLLLVFVVLGAYDEAPWDSRRARLARRIIRATHLWRH